MTVTLPSLIASNIRIQSNRIMRLHSPECVVDVDVNPYENFGVKGRQFVLPDGQSVLVVDCKTSSKQKDCVLQVKDLDDPSSWKNGLWLRYPPLAAVTPQDVLNSWQGAFRLVTEGSNTLGLRSPQIGALYATLAHWTVSEGEATVVLPTGTGKTETMLAVYAHERLEKLLVIVPTDALRTQLGEKFQTMGILKMFGIMTPESLYPHVGYLTKGFKSAEDAQHFIDKCNVVIATMSIIGACSLDARKVIAEGFSHMFVDEAHHLGARQWESFGGQFTGTTLQFTATPFREDGRRLPGKIIFNYPLRKAQDAGYFSKISFRPVLEFEPEEHDREIAKLAIQQLDDDEANGYQHVVLARCSSVARAEQVVELYKELAPNRVPILLHSKLKREERNSAVESLFNGASRIVVCVDMFGEGFDYPALKIGAMHDVHKSIGITLQFTGRFARNKPNIGGATIIANLANTKVSDALERLYAENADWNKLLQFISSEAISGEAELHEFMQGFSGLEDSPVSIRNLSPAASTVVYDTRDLKGWSWQPMRIEQAFDSENIVGSAHVNHQAQIVFVVVRNRKQVKWGRIDHLLDVTHELYVAYFNEEENFLFIFGSDRKGKQRTVAERLFRPHHPVIVDGDIAFRVFGDVTPLRLLNLGLKDAVNRLIGFRMFVGPDIGQGLEELDGSNRIMTNVFGRGYQDGQMMDYGSSAKGRIWSYRTTDNLLDWKTWCDRIAPRLRNSSYTRKQILERALVPKSIINVPDNHEVLSVTWNEGMWRFEDATLYFNFYAEDKRETLSLLLCEIQLVGMSSNRDSFLFEIIGEKGEEVFTARYRGTIGERGMHYEHEEGHTVSVTKGRYSSGEETAIRDFFDQYPPTFRFSLGSLLISNLWYEIEFDRSESFNKDQIDDWDWTGVDIKKESAWKHGANQHDSIQWKVMEEVRAEGFDIVFNDDGSGEIADIVAMRISEDRKTLHINFYHLKYSGEVKPGHRVNDLYAVCGQAQTSVHWKQHIMGLFSRMQYRAAMSLGKTPSFNRYFHGSQTDLQRCEYFASRIHIDLQIFIVQPGLKKSEVSEDQLELLAATRAYLQQTLMVPLSVISST